MEPNTPTEPTRRWEFSGREEIYDDGLVRLSLPTEFQLVISGDPDNLAFQIHDFPTTIIWSTFLLDEEGAERLGTPWGDVEAGLRFFLEGVGEPEMRRPVLLASGFWFSSNCSSQDGFQRSRCMLGTTVDDDLMLFAEMEFSLPQDLAEQSFTMLMQHVLRTFVRRAECSIGGPRINSSKNWLTVESLGMTFPDTLGGLTYDFAAEHNARNEPENLGLRFSDAAGRRADLLIFTAGEEFIEPGIESPLIREYFALTIDEIRDFYAPNPLQDIFAGERTYGRGEIPFLVHYFLAGSQDPAESPTLTALLLTARLDRFLKVRFTAAPGETQPENSALDAFMEDLANVLSK
jgi:hypothetical protein